MSHILTSHHEFLTVLNTLFLFDVPQVVLAAILPTTLNPPLSSSKIVAADRLGPALYRVDLTLLSWSSGSMLDPGG